MWILNFLPDFIVPLILLVGAVLTFAGFFLSFIPFIGPYKLPVQILGVVILSSGLYLYGGLSFKKDLEAEIAELKIKLARSEAEGIRLNNEISTKYISKKDAAKLKNQKVTEYIEREVKVYDGTCKLPEAAIKAHNAAALNKSIDEILTPSTPIDTTDHNAAATKKSIVFPKK